MTSHLFFLILISVLSLLGCRQAPLSKDALKAYALDAENGLIEEAVEGDLNLELLYRPKDLVILQEVNEQDLAAWDREAARLDSLDYFVLTLWKGSKSLEDYYSRDPKRFNEVLGYLSDEIAGDLSLHVASKAISPEGIVFAQGLGRMNASSILIVFKSRLASQELGKFSVVFDGTSQGLGRHDFEFDLKDIKSIPELKKI